MSSATLYAPDASGQDDSRGSREMTLPTTLTVKTGSLAVVLEAFQPEPTPVSLLYPRDRQLSPRVRAFIDCTVRTFAAK